jgi:4-amino-4-deoxy-L-arabinose transferase-like glycosyltransferase
MIVRYEPNRTPSALDWLYSCLLVLWTLPTLLVNSGQQSMAGSDEGYYAQMAREMYLSGNWLAPTFLGNPYFEKPPLNQWLIATSYTLFGVSEWSARFPSTLAAVLGVLMTYLIGREFFEARRAFLGALILPTIYLWMSNGRVAGQDVLLTFLELVGIWCLLQAPKFGSRFIAIGWGFMLGLSVLLKSSMAIVSVAALLPYLLLQNKQHKLVQTSYLYIGAGAGLALFGIWYWLASKAYGNAVYDGLFGILSSLSKRDFHHVGPFYYFWNLPANTFPWTFFALAGAWILWQEQKKSHFLLLTYPFTFLLVLQIFPTKTPYYLVQICPFLALLAGVALDRLWQQATREQSKRTPTYTGAYTLRSAQGIAWLSYLIAAFALLLLGLVVALYLSPNLVPGASLYLPLATALGVVWLLPWVCYMNRGWLGQWLPFWAVSVIGGPWLALVLAGLTTPLGNYSPAFKEFCQQKLAALVNPQEPIHLVFEGTGDRFTEFAALAFYTPTPGNEITAAKVINNREPKVWWLSPESRQALDKVGFIYQPLGQVQGWTLARSAR